MSSDYRQLWEDLGKGKGTSYLAYKFTPTHRVGLTNFLREEWIYSYLDPKSTDTVLDIGCASGRQLFRLAPKIKSGVGVDIAQHFIDTAIAYGQKQSIQNITFQRAEIEHLPFPDATFSKIICGEVLEHVADHTVALREMMRVLQPGGTLIISTPNLNADATVWGRFLRMIGVRSFKPITEFSSAELANHGDAHVREFSKKSMRAWLEGQNLDVAAITTASFIDGPAFDTLLKIPLRIPLLRWLIIACENLCSWTGIPFGRHLIVKAFKK